MNNRIESLEARRLLSLTAGSPDPAFGQGGTSSGAVGIASAPRYDADRLRRVEMAFDTSSFALPDGGLLMPLPRTRVSGPSDLVDESGIVRFRADGSIDTNWGTRGVARLPALSTANVSAVMFSIRRDGAGRVYVLRDGDRAQGISLTRLTPAGQVDVGFAGGGAVELPLIAGYDGSSDANFELDARGRSVVLGRDPDTVEPKLLRFTTTGQPDATLDGDGVAFVTFYGDVATDASNRIAIGGVAVNGDDSYARLVERRLAGGGVDASFGVAGRAVESVYGFDSIGTGAAPQLLPRPDGGYVFVGRDALDASLAFSHIDVRGTVDRSVGVDGRVTTQPIYGRPGGERQFALASNGDLLILGGEDVPLTEDGFLTETIGHIVRFDRAGRVVSDVLHSRLPADPTGSRLFPLASALRSDGSVLAVLSAYNERLPVSEVGMRIVGLASWRADGARDLSVRTLPRMAVREVLTVRSDGQPVFAFSDPIGSFAGRADRLADGTYRARTSTLGTNKSSDWRSSRGRVYASGSGADTTVIEQNGFIRTIDGGGAVSALPRNYLSINDVSPEAALISLLVMPSGRRVHGAVAFSNATAPIRITPQRATDNAFYSPRSFTDSETGLPMPGTELLGPDRQFVRSFGTDGAVSGVSDPWFADSRGRLLYFGTDRKTLHRLTRSGQLDASYSAVPVDGWNLDIDSRDRLIAWRVVTTSGPSSGEVQVRRYTVDGAIDASFGKNGEARVRHWLAQGSTADVYLDSADNVMVVTIDRTSSPRVKWAATKLLGTPTAARAAIAVGQANSAARAGVWSEVDVAAAVLA